MEINKIYNTDCIRGLTELEENSVDLVFTDPPYNVKKKYDNYNDNRTEEDYINWMRSVVGECIRVAKKGVIFYVGSKLTKTYFDLLPQSHLIIVHKRAIGAMGNNYFMQYHSMFSTAKPVVKTKDLWDDIRLPGEGYFFREPRYDTPGLTSQKLVEKVLDCFTIEGETILDPFMGTGTTAVACKLKNRNYIGFEQSKKYCDIAEERLSKIVLQD